MMHRSTGSHQIFGGKLRVASQGALIKSLVVLYKSYFLISESTNPFFDIKKSFSDIKK